MTNGLHEARHYSATGDTAQCRLCPHNCLIKSGKTGICRTRENSGGKLLLRNYGNYTSGAIDPIEKKPLYHFHPGRDIFSIGGLGCNLSCGFCQNWQISHGTVPTREITPESLADQAAAHAPASAGVAFTYNEPLIWFEFIIDCAPLLRDRGLKVVLVSNGFINPEPFAELAPHIDAMNIDFKSSDDSFYKKSCGGAVAPVMATIEKAVEAGIWVEVTQLVVTRLNDTVEQFERTASWLASLSKDIPLHLSRYFPNYKLDNPPTPPATLTRAWDICKKHLNHVYVGNVADTSCSDTVCPDCGGTIISRRGYYIDAPKNCALTCPSCGKKVSGVE